MATPVERWYPPQKGALADYDAWNAHRQAYDRIYDLHDQLNELTEKMSAMPAAAAAKGAGKAASAATPPTVSATHLNGILIKAVPPLNGQKLTYNATSGQFEWQ